MSDPTKTLVDSLNEGHMADLAAPEEMLAKIETFLSMGFNANAKYHAKEFENRYGIDIEELIAGTRYENSCLADL